MDKKTSEYKKIFEDNSLSDLQKYKMISALQNKKKFSGSISRFVFIVFGLNLIIWPYLLILPDVETDKPSLSHIVALKD